MNSDLFFDNKKYISVKEASSLTGYSKDYIGQLSRGGKIDSKRIGRGWYVGEDSILNYKKNFAKIEPQCLEELSTVSRIDEIKTTFYSKAFSAISEKRDSLKSHLSDIKNDRLPRYKMFLNEVASFFDFGFVKKTAKNLGTFAVCVALAIGLFSIKNDAVAFAKTASRGVTLSGISEAISLAPQRSYNAFADILDFYAEKILQKEIAFGHQILDFANTGVDVLKNPPLAIVATTKSVALGANKITDVSAKSASGFISKTNRNFISFVYESADEFAVLQTELGHFANKTITSVKENTASVALATKTNTLNPVDHAGVAVYNGLNNWFDSNVYSPIMALFGPRSLTVVNINKSASPAPKPNTVTTKTVERTVERVVEKNIYSGISQVDLDLRLQELNNKLMSEFSRLSTGSGGSVTNIYREIALSQRVDSLSGTTITNPTISGGTITNTSIHASSLATDSLDVSGNIILSGSNRYINFGSTVGTDGYGFYDNGGTLQFKNSSGVWADIGSGGGASSGGGTFSTTTSTVAGVLVNYPNNNTDVLNIGSISTTTGKMWFDPNTSISYFKGNVGIGTTSPYAPLSVVGQIVAGYFTATTSTASTFPVANITKLSNLTGNGFVKTSGGDGTLSVDTTAYTASTRALTLAGTANQITSSAGSQDLSADRTWTLSIPSQFNIQQASTTMFSSFGGAYIGSVGGNATTTILGNATSTFGAGVSATYLNITGTSATSTFARGIDLAGGCFSVNGICVGGSGGSGTVTSVALSDTNSTLTIGGTPVTTSGTLTATLNLAHANIWTALQSFNYSSSTIYSSFATASTTNLVVNGSSFNNLLGTGLSNSAGALTVSSVPNASLQNSTISGIALGASLADLTATNGTLTFSGAYNGGTARTVGLNLGNANTWTALQTFNYSSSTIYSSFATASTTNLVINGSSFNNLLGTGLALSGNSLTTTLGTSVDLTSEITGTLPVANGGTNATAFAPNSIITSNSAGTALIATTSQLTVGSLISTTTATSYFTGALGIASSTPFGRLSVNPIAGDSIGFVVGSSTATQLSVSSLGFGTTTLAGLNVSGQATSTSNVGFNLSTGCFAVNGTCLTQNSGTVTSVGLSDTNSTLTIGSTPVTTSGTITATLNLAHANIWSALQSFNYSSSTIYSSFATASTTNLVVNGSSFNNLLGSGLLNTGNALTLDRTGDWTGTLDGIDGSAVVQTSRALTVAGTANQITSSAGAQDLSSNRTWTLSFPNQTIFPQYASTTLGFSTPYASTTSLFGANLTTCNSTTGKLTYDSTTGFFGCGTDFNTPSAFPFTVNTGYNSTTTAIGFLGGLFSTASTTLSSNLFLSSLSQGLAYTGSNGLVGTIATTTLTGNSQIALSNAITVIGGSASALSIVADSIGDSQLAFDTGQALTTASSPTFAKLNLTHASTTYASFTTASTTNFILNGSSFNNLLGTGLSNSAGALTVSSVPNASLQNSTISGIALGASLADLTATNGTLTFSGAYNGGTARTVGLNLANANAFTALQQFNANASTTQLSAYSAYIGGTATTTFTNAGYVGVGSSTPWALLSVNPNALGSGVPEFAIGSSSATHFVVDGAGNVGVATTTPSSNYALSVTGSGYFSNGVTLGTALAVGSGGTGATSFTSNGVLYGNSTSAISVTAQGGANTILTANAGVPSFSATPTIGTSLTTPLVIGGTAAGSDLTLRSTSGTGNTGADIIFQAGTNGGTETMRIKGSGFVGIGEATPIVKLHISQASANTSLTTIALADLGIITQNTDTTVGNFAFNSFVDGGGATGAMIGARLYNGGNQSGDLMFVTRPNSSGGLLERMVVTKDGLVGVGSTTPGSLLSIGGNGTGINFYDNATSTFSSKGINLYGGCFAISGTCISGGAGGAGTVTSVGLSLPSFFTVTNSPVTTSGTLTATVAFPANSILVSDSAGTNIIATTSQLTVGSLISTTTATSYFTGKLGIGTTTPFGRFSVNPIAGDSIGFVVGSSTATQLSVSSLGFGTTTLSGLNIAGQATSTSNVGFNITSGCFAMNGTCVSGGGGSGTVTSVALSDTNSTLTIGGTPVTTSGTLTATLNLAHANIWTALQSFNYSSSTIYSSFATASTTNLIINGSSFNNLLGDGLDISSNALIFDCSDVVGTGLSCSGEDLTLNATGDWTGTIDGNNFAGGAIGAGELVYGGSSGSFSELAVSTNGFVLALSGGVPTWVATTTLSTISGTLAVAKGGTGLTTLGGTNALLYTSSTDTITSLAQGGANVILTANSGAPAWSAAPTIGTSLTTPLLIGGTAVSSTLTLQSTSGVGSSDAIKFLVGNAGATEAGRITTSGFWGIGTTTPQWLMQIAKTGSPQMVLSDGSTNNGWAFRNAGGNLYLSTTSPTSFATSTNTAFALEASSETALGVGTTSPWRTLSVTGTVGFDGLTTATTGNYLCIDTTTKQITSGTTCTLSSERFKTDIISLLPPSSLATTTSGLPISALAEVLALRPVSFRFKDGFGDNGLATQLGFIAEEARLVDPRLVPIDENGIPNGFYYQNYTAVLTKAIQEMHLDITATSTLLSDNTPSLFGRLLATLKDWGVEITNTYTRITSFFVGDLHVENQLCVDDVCVDKNQLKALLLSVNGTSGNGTGGGGGSATSTSDTTIPIITILGGNPTTITIGVVYSDLGATVTDTDENGAINSNLGLHFNLDGADVTDISLDTSTSTTHTIIYSATDGAGNTGTATRIVSVVAQ